jgi:hypothetical protein
MGPELWGGCSELNGDQVFVVGGLPCSDHVALAGDCGLRILQYKFLTHEEFHLQGEKSAVIVVEHLHERGLDHSSSLVGGGRDDDGNPQDNPFAAPFIFSLKQFRLESQGLLFTPLMPAVR